MYHHPQLFERTPSISFHDPHDSFLDALVNLNDGSFLSCSSDNTAKRWGRTTNNDSLQLLGTYQGHENSVWCAMEKDDNTLLTASLDNTLKLWNKTTCECLATLPMRSSIISLLKTKDKTRFVCGLGYAVEFRRVSDLQVLSSFRIDVGIICELEDGSFVSATWNTMNRWDETGTVLQTFSGHAEHIYSVIELTRDVVVSASLDSTVKMWKVSTGECLRTLTLHSGIVFGLAKVKDGVFASGCMNGKLLVWNDKGESIETHQNKKKITAMTILRDGSIVTADRYEIVIRRLLSSSLTQKCAKVIGKNTRTEVLEGLPEELHQMCLMYHDCRC